MHGVGRDALGGVDRAGIAETRGVVDVAGGQPDGEPAAVMSDRKVTARADAGDGPAVAVFDPVGGGEAESPVVAAGDNHIPSAGLVPVRQPDHRIRHVAVEAVVSGSPVQLGHLIAGRGKHDRVEPSRSIGNPRVERILSRGSHVADMNTAVIKVEHQPRMVALADGKRCCRFGGVGEAMQLSQPEGAISVLDVAKYTAGADRGELLIITDQAYVRTPANGELHSGVQRQGVGHAGFVDDQQGRRADRCRPLRKVAVL